MKKHILIVDDEESIRNLLAQSLKGRGYDITTASTASEAIAAARKQAPDLIMSDLQLEDADGLQMIAELKTITPRTPVILLTGVLFDPEVVRDTLSQKIDCYLPKTSSLALIVETVDRLVG